MEREEFKKKLIENYKSKIKVKFDCKWTKCNECPFYNRVCPSDDDMYQKVMEEAWAEIHGYIKKEDLRPKVNEEFIDNLVALLQRGATFSVINNVIDCEGELWMGQDDQEDNWYKWIMKNLFVEDTEKVVNDSKPISQELSSISCVVKIKDKWDYLKDTLKVIYEQETCISKKDAYKKVIKIMEEYEA